MQITKYLCPFYLLKLARHQFIRQLLFRQKHPRRSELFHFWVY